MGMYAVNASSGDVLPGCVQYRKANEADTWNKAHMGACGHAPTAARALPVAVCADADAAGCIPPSKLASLTLTLDKPVGCRDGNSTRLRFRGMRCGPGLGFVQWSTVAMLDGAACTFARSGIDRKSNADWVGGCGVTPYNIPMPAVVCTAAQMAAGVGELGITPPASPSPSPLPSTTVEISPRSPR